MTTNRSPVLAENASPEQVSQVLADVHRHYLAMRKELRKSLSAWTTLPKS